MVFHAGKVQELKQLKKRAKAAKAASQATSGGGGSGSDGGEATAEQSSPPTSGKQKKRKQKEAAEQQEQEQQPAAKKAKGKKGKAAAAGGHAAPQGMAAVGEPPGSRKPLVKALYEEAPEVAAMSADQIKQWRKERKTKVEGCELHPITAFAQSGAGGGVGRLASGRRAVVLLPCWLGRQATGMAGIIQPLTAPEPPTPLVCCPPLQACRRRSCTRPATSSSPHPSRHSACPLH